MKGLDESAREIAGLLEEQNIPYALMGGFAVRVHALPRPTFDVAFTVLLARERLAELHDCVTKLGYTISEPQRGGWVDSVKGMPVVKFQWYLADRPIDIDMFLAETPFQGELLNRRQRHQAEGWAAWFVTPEDLILLKLLADRPKVRTDVADILFIQPSLDAEYFRLWAARLGISQAWEAALKQGKAHP